MPRRHTVETLPQDQRDFILDRFLDGDDPRRISLAFEDKFKTKLAKSSLDRWVRAVAIPLAEQYRVQRAIARELAKQISETEGADKHSLIIDNIEDHLLSSLHEVAKTDSYKLLLVQQEEKRRQLQEQKLKLDHEKLALEREKVHGVALDRVKLGEEYAGDLLEYIGDDAEGLRWFQRHAKAFQEFVQRKYEIGAVARP